MEQRKLKAKSAISNAQLIEPFISFGPKRKGTQSTTNLMKRALMTKAPDKVILRTIFNAWRFENITKKIFFFMIALTSNN